MKLESFKEYSRSHSIVFRGGKRKGEKRNRATTQKPCR